MIVRGSLNGVVGCGLVLALALSGAGLAAGAAPDFTPGASGVGDRYFPQDGNGGYQVRHYLLDLTYDPESKQLTGVATIDARARKDLSRFNLDLDGLTVDAVRVNGHKAKWHRHDGELTVNPHGPGLPGGNRFEAVIRYHGHPRPFREPALGRNGFFTTDDGILIAGQPHGAATWFPVNDHPTDTASYTFRVTAPSGLEVIANGVLEDSDVHGDQTTWTWEAAEPMASYLATVDIGEFDVTSREVDGISYWDAIDSDLFDPVAAPRTGSRFAMTGQADNSYKRLSRVIDVPADGATVTFQVDRQTEEDWDFFFVEAHTVGENDWTTLRDQNDHSSNARGNSCPSWQEIHPFLKHYQRADEKKGCLPRGTTGRWRAASGRSDGYEEWTVDLGRYAGKSVEVSLTQASDEVVQESGVFVDDIAVSTGQGSTSFEADGDVLDGWTVPGPPAGSPGNSNDWFTGGADDTPPSRGEIARSSLDRQPEILAFLADQFGPYPFDVAGGIVDDYEKIQFALETQTRPVYAAAFFGFQPDGDSVVVHELTHQWFGDDLPVRRWRNIWLNEGFATYAEWLWSKHEGGASPQETFQDFATLPASSGFWSVKPGNPGPGALFDGAVYYRGALTLQRLRVRVGSEDFFQILRRWAATRSGENVTTHEFIRLAERISGRELSPLFRHWLFTARKPHFPGGKAARQHSMTTGEVSRLLGGEDQVH